jgi:predicted NAD-dependent protein-ADP-ribosyltransferase YbiA (DUF1768 family)
MARNPRSRPKKNSEAEAASDADLPVFFFGADKENGWLSNMYMNQFTWKGRAYVCNEQFFQFAKAALCEDTVRTVIHSTMSSRSHALVRKRQDHEDGERYTAQGHRR